MTICDVRQEAGPEFDRLGAKIAEVTARIAPVLTETIGLTLPDPAVLRLVSKQACRTELRQFHTAQWQQVRGFLRTKIPPGYSGTHGIDFALKRYRRSGLVTRQPWMATTEYAVEDGDGRPMLLFAADVLAHIRPGEEELHALIAHALTHLCQHRATSGTLTLLTAIPLATYRDSGSPNAAGLLAEGHAEWAREAVTKALTGRTACWWDHPNATAYFNSEMKKITEAQGRKVGEPRPEYETGRLAVSAAIETTGVEEFNKIWQTPEKWLHAEDLAKPGGYAAYLSETALPTSADAP